MSGLERALEEERSAMRRAVGRGITFLDHRLHGLRDNWRRDIKWQSLDMDSFINDVIGQLFGYGYRDRGMLVPYSSHIPGGREDHVTDWSVYHGFSADIGSYLGYGRAVYELTKVWQNMGPELRYIRSDYREGGIDE